MQVNDSNVDIVCLQEVLRADIQREIYESLLVTYPYIHSAVNFSAPFNVQPQPAACNQTELQLFGACFQTQCPFTDREALIACLPARY